MLAVTGSVALVGAEARLVQVEVAVGQGVPCLRIVGMAARSVCEAEQRVRSAIVASEEKWPLQRIVANLAPGALRKEGTHFDLALALGILASKGRIACERLREWTVMGELALDGRVRPVPGVLAAAIACREQGRRGVICPAPNGCEAALIDGIEVMPVKSLREAISVLDGRASPAEVERGEENRSVVLEDLADVRGHRNARRALEIAAAGGHNILLSAPPGQSSFRHRQALVVKTIGGGRCGYSG